MHVLTNENVQLYNVASQAVIRPDRNGVFSPDRNGTKTTGTGPEPEPDRNRTGTGPEPDRNRNRTGTGTGPKYKLFSPPESTEIINMYAFITRGTNKTNVPIYKKIMEKDMQK